ncbi:glycosyltransferase family 4 protein [uncultured Roseobacter sp.]|uniref:glycosyltransferase family 4 protein n=1 Tax=uncultured Roseobacter sp. TaxID=114847 RepID=UPI00261FAEA4|nr:glycosyltransferase family 4 protein [uncultured Roseobacter sp.]
MRITFISPFASLAGGVRVKAIYAAYLQARGHDVKVISLPGKKRTIKTRIKAALGLVTRRHVRPPTPLLDVLGENHIILDHNGPVTATDVPDGDVVIATFWETADWVAALPASKGRKFYLLQDYETFKKGKFDAVGATYQLPLQKIAVSEYIAQMLAENHGIEDVTVVPNSVDCEQFNAPLRQKGKDLTVGFLYTSKPRKNIRLAIDVLKQARQTIPGLRAVAFGSIPPRETPALPDWIRYYQTPLQSQIPEIYAACDIWLFTSLHEGFGLPVLEAMACGTPVLATSAGAAPQIVNGRNGLLLAPRADVFVAALKSVAEMSPKDWRAMSDAARETARAYSWDDATDRLLQCLRQEIAA